jgi:hypothetical protein
MDQAMIGMDATRLMMVSSGAHDGEDEDEDEDEGMGTLEVMVAGRKKEDWTFFAATNYLSTKYVTIGMCFLK